MVVDDWNVDCDDWNKDPFDTVPTVGDELSPVPSEDEDDILVSEACDDDWADNHVFDNDNDYLLRWPFDR